MPVSNDTMLQQLPPVPAVSSPVSYAAHIPTPDPAAGLTRPESIAQARAFPDIEVRDPAPIISEAPSLEYDPALQQMEYFDGQMGYRYDARNRVIKGRTPIKTGFKIDDVTPLPWIESPAYGPGNSYIDTTRKDGKDIHGGGPDAGIHSSPSRGGDQPKVASECRTGTSMIFPTESPDTNHQLDSKFLSK